MSTRHFSNCIYKSTNLHEYLSGLSITSSSIIFLRFGCKKRGRIKRQYFTVKSLGQAIYANNWQIRHLIPNSGQEPHISDRCDAKY